MNTFHSTSLNTTDMNTVSFSNFLTENFSPSIISSRSTRRKTSTETGKGKDCSKLPSTSIEAKFKHNLRQKFSDIEVEEIIKIYQKTISLSTAATNSINSNVTVTIKNLFPMDKVRHGIELKINGKCYPIKIKSFDSMMIYLCLLLRIKQGKTLYINELVNKPMRKLSEFNQNESHRWFINVFKSIYGYESDWTKKYYNHDRIVHQAKSSLNRNISDALNDMPKEVIQLLSITTIKAKGDVKYSYYQSNLRPENIVIDEKLLHLLSAAGIQE